MNFKFNNIQLNNKLDSKFEYHTIYKSSYIIYSYFFRYAECTESWPKFKYINQKKYDGTTISKNYDYILNIRRLRSC